MEARQALERLSQSCVSILFVEAEFDPSDGEAAEYMRCALDTEDMLMVVAAHGGQHADVKKKFVALFGEEGDWPPGLRLKNLGSVVGEFSKAADVIVKWVDVEVGRGLPTLGATRDRERSRSTAVAKQAERASGVRGALRTLVQRDQYFWFRLLFTLWMLEAMEWTNLMTRDVSSSMDSLCDI